MISMLPFSAADDVAHGHLQLLHWSTSLFMLLQAKPGIATLVYMSRCCFFPVGSLLSIFTLEV